MAGAEHLFRARAERESGDGIGIRALSLGSVLKKDISKSGASPYVTHE